MSEIDPASRRVVTDFPESPRRSGGRGGVFKTILRAASTVASVAIPGAGPAIGAVVDAVNRRNTSPVFGQLGGESETLRYLELQREVERETRMYETASNVLKARHDATMSSIRNIKS